MSAPRLRLSTRERQRLFAMHDGVCHICTVAIDPVHEAWDIEHVRPLSMGGDNSDANRRPAHRFKCHPAKTALEAIARAKADRNRARHLGARAPSDRPLPCGRLSRHKRTFPSRGRPWGETVERAR